MDRALDLLNLTVIFGKINLICVALGLGILFHFAIVMFRMTYHELPSTASEIQQDESDKERDTRLDIRDMRWGPLKLQSSSVPHLVKGSCKKN